MKILYVEDDSRNADLVCRELQRSSPHTAIEVAPTLTEARSRLAEPDTIYDLVLIDLKLPDGTGLELLEEIREQEKSLAVVILTGAGDEEIAIQALRLGAANYLVKNPGYLFKLPAILENAYSNTELERERARLAESEARFRLLVENARDVIYRFRLKPTPAFEYVSPSVVGMVGYTPEEFYADPEFGFKLTHPADRSLLVPVEADRDFEPLLVLRWIRKDGAVIWTEQQNTPVYDENGELVAIEGIARDITLRQQAQERLREREESFRLLFESNPHPMWVYDLETLAFLEVNNSAVDHYGYSHDEFLTMRLPDIRPPEDFARLLEVTQSKRPTFQRSGEWRHRLKNGQIINVEITSHTLEFDGRRAALVVAQDITESKQARTAEREQRQLAEALRDSAATLISALDLKSVMNTILENVARVVPHDAANIMLIEKDQAHPVYWRGYHPELTTFLQEFRILITDTPNLHQMFATGLPFLIPDTDQYSAWIHSPLADQVKSYVAAPIRSHEQVIGFLNLDSAEPGFFTELHAQRLQAFADQASLAIEHAQLYEEIQRHARDLEQRVAKRTAELQQSEARYRAIIEDQTDLVCRFLPGGILTFVNQTYCRHFNRTSEELLGTSLFDLVPDDEHPRVEQHIASLNRENPIATFEDHQIREDGQEQWFQWSDHVLFDEAGNFVEYQSVGRDITKRKLAEDQLHQLLDQAMKLSELRSRYMSMAAHDLRNPLAGIQGAVSMLQQYSDQLTDERKQAKYTQIHNAIKLMVDMLDDILTIGQTESGKTEFNPVSLKVVEFCKTIIDEMKPVTTPTHQIVFSYQGDCSTANLDPKLLRHILGNLLSNALKYSPDDTDVSFTIDCNADQISFYIQDQGIGIPKAEQARLFEAFHRASNAKNVRGTGLGLAIVKQSVDLHGGTITFNSQENMGTTFTVILPHPSDEKQLTANSP